MKHMILPALVLLTIFSAQLSQAECFDIVNGPVKHVANAQLDGNATQVCALHVTDINNNHYASLVFRNETEKLASFKSPTETIEECKGFCHTYALEGGSTHNSVGLDRGDVTVQIYMVGEVGTLIIDKKDNYTIRLQQRDDQ